jgi:predicted transcriptional regulator
MKVKSKEIIVEMNSPENVSKEVDNIIKKAKSGKPVKPTEKIVVENLDVLRKILTPERMRILHVIKKYKPESILELSEILERDRRNVIKDLNYLEGLGLIEISKKKTKKLIKIPSVKFDEVVVRVPI